MNKRDRYNFQVSGFLDLPRFPFPSLIDKACPIFLLDLNGFHARLPRYSII